MPIENSGGAAKGEILIVDDNVSNLKYLSGILTQAGYVVRAASDGELALRSIAAKMPDIVLLDIQMPGIDGIEVCKRLKQNVATSELPIIFLSAQEDTDIKVKALEAGGADYVTKPFQPFEVLARITTHVSMARNIAALKCSEERFRCIVESSPIAKYFYHLESDDRLILVGANPSADRIIGIRHQELIGKTIEEAFPQLVPTNLPTMYRNVAKGLLGTQSFEIPYKDERFSGYYNVTVFMTGPNQIAVDFIDISERKQAEEALQESTESFRTLIEGIPDIVMRFDRECRHLFVSNNVHEFVELEAPQFLGKNHRELGFSDEMCTLWEDAIRQVFVTGIAYETDFSIEGKRGHTFFNWRLLPEFDAQGTIKSVLSLSRDISSQKRDEHLIAQSQFYLKKAQEIGKIGHFSFDAVTNVVVCSNELLRLFDIDTTCGKPLFEAFAAAVLPEDGPLIFPFIDRAVKEGVPYDVEHRVKHRNGTILHVNAKGEVIDTPDGLRMVGTVQDITERNRMEEALQNSQKLESLGLLAGGIAHDFNNLLGGIYGYIDMAGEGVKEEKTSRHLSKAMNTIERARGLTLQLLTFAKGGAPIKKIGNLFPFVQETAQFALSGSNVSCTFNVQPNLYSCDFDKNQIGQVIDNIVINAKQAMANGGTMEVVARNSIVTKNEHPPLAKGDYVVISIKDSGIGIPKNILPKIFDPFYTTKATGHGLGLATCFSIVNRHGGSIEVESEPGAGSTFHIFLPALHDSTLSGVEKVAALHTGTGVFLVMDDQEVMRDTIGEMLTSMGYTVVGKENGNEAIEFVATELKANRKIAGMIFDLTIPGGMGGREAIDEIRKIDPETAVFVTSGYAEDPIMANPDNYGFVASICKPFKKSELSEILNSYIPAKK